MQLGQRESVAERVPADDVGEDRRGLVVLPGVERVLARLDLGLDALLGRLPLPLDLLLEPVRLRVQPVVVASSPSSKSMR